VSEHALVVPFAELAGAVGDWLERTVPTKPSHGMPPHVTLLYPAPDDVDGIAELVAACEPFDVSFRRLDRFPGTVWLAPEPAAPFRMLTEALVARYPAFPPYRGVFKQIVPHLTVAQAQLDEAAAAVAPLVPLHGRAESAVLLERAEPERWLEVATFRLGAR
jgi:2'-5' RNA ligase